MKIKIIRAIVTNSSGRTIIKPEELLLNNKRELEQYRRLLQTDADTRVLFIYEEQAKRTI